MSTAKVTKCLCLLVLHGFFFPRYYSHRSIPLMFRSHFLGAFLHIYIKTATCILFNTCMNAHVLHYMPFYIINTNKTKETEMLWPNK